MTSKLNLGPGIDGLEVLAPIAKAVPILGASVEGSLEALKQILQYTEVSLVACRSAAMHESDRLHRK
jgi:hypothetical protein